MKLSTRVSLVAALLVSGVSAQAACVYPQAPQNLPNGATATKEQMLAAKSSITDYQKAVEGAYLPCLDQEKNTAVAALELSDPEYATKKSAIEAIHAKKYNAAVDELTAVAGQFNEEIKAYKAKDAKQ